MPAQDKTFRTDRRMNGRTENRSVSRMVDHLGNGQSDGPKGTLCGWIILTKGHWRWLWFFVILVQTNISGQTRELSVIWDAIKLMWNQCNGVCACMHIHTDERAIKDCVLAKIFHSFWPPDLVIWSLALKNFDRYQTTYVDQFWLWLVKSYDLYQGERNI